MFSTRFSACTSLAATFKDYAYLLDRQSARGVFILNSSTHKMNQKLFNGPRRREGGEEVEAFHGGEDGERDAERVHDHRAMDRPSRPVRLQNCIEVENPRSWKWGYR